MVTPYLMLTRLGTSGTLATYVYFSDIRKELRSHATPTALASPSMCTAQILSCSAKTV